ncbi:GIP, partial [Symbiodinium microadriaticum]
MLKHFVAASRRKIREAVTAINKTWFDHMLTFCDSGAGVDSMIAVQSAPVFRDVPQEALYGISEAIAEDNGWEALRGLIHLNRRTRERLWSSRQWVVHLFVGKGPNESIHFLERQGFDVLELDLERGKSQDGVSSCVVYGGKVQESSGGPTLHRFSLLLAYLTLEWLQGGSSLKHLDGLYQRPVDYDDSPPT